MIEYIYLALYLEEQCSFNKQVYIADKMSCHMLRLAATLGGVSEMVYNAMFFYKKKLMIRYKEALYVIENIKVMFAQPGLMYRDKEDLVKYIEAFGGLSWSTKMRKTEVHDIILNNKTCYINTTVCSIELSG